MLLPAMTDYNSFIADYVRPSDPPSYNYADVIDGYAKDPDRKALIWANEQGEERQFTFAEISAESQRIANALKARGIGRGDRVMVMLPRIPEWQMVMIALFRIGAVSMPTLTMLRPRDLEHRITQCQPKAVIAVASETSKFEGILGKDVARLAVHYGPGQAEGWDDLAVAMAGADPVCLTEPMTRDEPGIIYFTSGSTGLPKGVTHSAYFAFGFLELSAYWFDLNDQNRDDIFWGTADTGWAFSSTCTLIGPWIAGVCAFTYDGPFDPEQRLELMERYGVTQFAASASEFRWILGEDVAAHDLSHLRLSITSGEALDGPTAQRWMALTGTRIHESYGQTESFMSVANFPVTEIRPGSMGLPMPGMPVDIIDEETFEVLGTGGVGHIALRAPFHCEMLGYWNDPDRNQTDTSAVLQQHPDLCASIGMWGIMQQGTAQAIKDAGKLDQITVIASGEGVRSDCDALQMGLFDLYINYDARLQGHDVMQIARFLLQAGQKPGTFKIANFSRAIAHNKETGVGGACFDL